MTTVFICPSALCTLMIQSSSFYSHVAYLVFIDSKSFIYFGYSSISRLDRKNHTMADKLPKVFGKDGLYGIVFYNSSFARGGLYDFEVVNPFS